MVYPQKYENCSTLYSMYFFNENKDGKLESILYLYQSHPDRRRCWMLHMTLVPKSGLFIGKIFLTQRCFSYFVAHNIITKDFYKVHFKNKLRVWTFWRHVFHQIDSKIFKRPFNGHFKRVTMLENKARSL
jgi:hypothetical protein